MNLNKERKLIRLGYKKIAGLDEAGRGAWAGPIVAGCVLIEDGLDLRKKENYILQQVNDSKKLNPQLRQLLYKTIIKNLIWSVGVVTVAEIEKIGINKANHKALLRAFKNLKKPADFVLVDFWQDLPLVVANQGIIRADSNFFSVAAASIIAKVYRDNLMKSLDLKDNRWQFAKHKGYGTAEHLQAIKKYGISNQHRISFLSNIKFN